MSKCKARQVSLLVIILFVAFTTAQDDYTYPSFTSPDPFQFTVLESTKPSTKIGKVTATEQYMVPPIFSMEPNGGMFYIDQIEGVILNGTLDYESQESYELLVTATNFYDRSLETTKILTVNVVNENDEKPKFNDVNYVFTSIPESTQVGTELMEIITVTDRDLQTNPVNLEVTCDSESSIEYQLGCSQFIIHQKNDPDKALWVGKLILQRPIDSEANTQFKLKLDANDGKHVTSQIITIPIEDLNDNKPIFTSVKSVVTLPEDVQINAVVLSNLVVTDADKGSGYLEVKCDRELSDVAKETCEVFDVERTSPIASDRWEGDIVLRKNIDYESSKKAYVINLMATDGIYIARHNISVIISDINDHNPKFTPLKSNWIVSEDAPIGTSLSPPLEVIDIDETSNVGVLTVTCDQSLRGNYITACQNFRIVRTSDENKRYWKGQIVVRNKLDFEIYPNFTIRIKATDGNRVSYEERVIKVTDVNDNSPRFSRILYNSSVALSAPYNSTLMPKIIVTDVDLHNVPLEVICEKTEDSFYKDSCNIFSVKKIFSNSSYWIGQLVLKDTPIFNTLKQYYVVTLTAFDGKQVSNKSFVSVQVLNKPAQMSHTPHSPILGQNVTVKCQFAFQDGFKNTTVQLFKESGDSYFPFLWYFPENNTHVLTPSSDLVKHSRFKFHRSGHYGYVEFQIGITSCDEQAIKCALTYPNGHVYSTTQNLLFHTLPMNVTIHRGNCKDAQPGYIPLTCQANGGDPDVTIKWYTSLDGKQYKEVPTMDYSTSKAEYDQMRCHNSVNSTLMFNHQGRRNTVKCEATFVIEGKTYISDTNFRIGPELPPESLNSKLTCTGVTDGSVHVVCWGFTGSPASGIKFYTMGNNKSPSIEVPPTHIQSDKPRYVNETCQFFERAIYKFKGNMEETRRVMCVTERQIDDKLFRLYKILRVTPKNYCPGSGRIYATATRANGNGVLVLTLFSIMLLYMHN